MSDEQLVQQHRAGRTQAFAQLVQRYEGDLFRFLVRFVRKPAVADDLFQETFLQVHISIDQFETDRRFRPWLFTIAANKARDHLRRNKNAATTSLSSSPGTGRDGPAMIDLLQDDLPLPDKSAIDQETRQLVQQTVEQLPDHLKEILLLAYFERFAYKEIADMLGIPVGTVKSRLHAAVAAFAQAWKYGKPPT
jgi:RNA polymerase sigma-70 factor (ECF subfamily)